MNNALEMRVDKPEALLDLKWSVKDSTRFGELVKLANTNNLAVKDNKAFKGAKMLGVPESVEDASFLSSDRSIAVIPAIEGESSLPNRVIHFPTEKMRVGYHFDANLAAQRTWATFAQDTWNKTKEIDKLGSFPIPPGLKVEPTNTGSLATVVEYRPGIKNVGKGLSSGVHELDTSDQLKSVEEIRRLVRVLDKLHVTSDEIKKNAQLVAKLPKNSWLHPENPTNTLRGQEWWKNSNPNIMSRYVDLPIAATKLGSYFREIDGLFDAPEQIGQMINNNLKLYPHQDGTVDDTELVGETVVAHGTLYPGQIATKIDSNTGLLNYTVTGGDRSHYGLRGESIDWLISASAASPEHQRAMIDEFIHLHPGMKDRRGLAMHVMYRSLIEGNEWFLKNGKIDEVKNLVQLTYDILKGNGIWKGVNSSLSKENI